MWNVQTYAPKGEKVMRMMQQTPLIENGRVLIPERAPWLDDYLHELRVFPCGKHDDQVDSTSQSCFAVSRQPHHKNFKPLPPQVFPSRSSVIPVSY